jgi:hypothetical protein
VYQSSQTELLTITGNYRLRFFEHSFSVLRETSRRDDDDKPRKVNQAAWKQAAPRVEAGRGALRRAPSFV